jgi:tRNA modification GTPase
MTNQIRNPNDGIQKSVARLMTAPGAAAIAVVRLVGPLAREFIQAHIDGKVAAGRAVHVKLHADGAVIDDPIVFVADAFTEIHLHGGPWIVQSVLELARGFGFEVTAEFLPDAKIADGETVVEREIEAWLPLARTELAIATLLAQREAWEKMYLYPFLAGEMLGDESLVHLLNPPRVAIVGAPNSGKSTLANQLFGQEKSIVADHPGTTRDWVGEYANIDGLVVMLVDTPGQRETADTIEESAIAQSRTEIARAEMVIFVLDRTEPIEDQMELLRHFPGAVVVENKMDRPAAWTDSKGIAISAKSGAELEVLRSRIKAEFQIGARRIGEARWWTARQREFLTTKSQRHKEED